MDDVKLTAWEKAQIVRLELRGARRAVADIQHQPEIDRAIERIREKARKRAAAEKKADK